MELQVHQSSLGSRQDESCLHIYTAVHESCLHLYVAMDESCLQIYVVMDESCLHIYVAMDESCLRVYVVMDEWCLHIYAVMDESCLHLYVAMQVHQSSLGSRQPMSRIWMSHAHDSYGWVMSTYLDESCLHIWMSHVYIFGWVMSTYLDESCLCIALRSRVGARIKTAHIFRWVMSVYSFSMSEDSWLGLARIRTAHRYIYVDMAHPNESCLHIWMSLFWFLSF